MSEPSYSPSFVKTLFNSMSKSYERMNYITSFGFSIRWRHQMIKGIPKSPIGQLQVMDLLTGMGEAWRPIKKRYPQSELHALDFSPLMLAQAKINSIKYYNDHITFYLDDILQSQLPVEQFDIVVCAFGLKTFNESQIEILAKVVRDILKPGGHLAFIEVSKPESPLLNFFYAFYLGKIIPILGKLFLGNTQEYKMLWKYTQKFENANVANSIFNKAGLNTEYRRYFGGCATGFVGSKPLS